MGDLAEPLGITTSAVLQHLNVFERSRLVTSRKTGRVRMCQLDPVGPEAAPAWIEDRRAQWERRLDRLGDTLVDEGSAS